MTFSSTRVLAPLGLLMALGMNAGVGLAQSLSVSNPSFENPQVPAGFPAVTVVTDWSKNPPPPPEFGITAEQWDQMAGIFPNPAVGQPRHITNADGNQVAFLFAVPGVSLSQQTANTYTAGLSYTLQAGLRGGGALTPGTQFRVSLFYTDDTSARVTLASQIVSSTEALATASELQPVSVSLGTVSGSDVWQGRAIGVELMALSPNGAPGIAYWEVDNLQLTATVPEPSTLALTGVAAGWMVLLWRRARRSS